MDKKRCIWTKNASLGHLWIFRVLSWIKKMPAKKKKKVFARFYWYLCSYSLFDKVIIGNFSSLSIWRISYNQIELDYIGWVGIINV